MPSTYDRKTKNDTDPSSKQDEQLKQDPTKPSTADESKVKVDEKNGPDLAALNANGPGTDEAHRAAAAQEGDEAADGALVVAEGKSITSQRGILGPGASVSPKDVSGGQERLDELEKAGALVRRGRQQREPSDLRRDPASPASDPNAKPAGEPTSK